MGDLTDNESVQVDAEGEGILGEFTFTGKPFEGPRHAASSADGQNQEPELVGAPVSATPDADLSEDASQVERAERPLGDEPAEGSAE